METDPVVSNPDHYRLLFENDRVRVLDYLDAPGDQTTPHRHPDSVMVTLSSFRRRLDGDGESVEVQLPSGAARWLPAQSHAGRNTGDTETHTIFIELKEPSTSPAAGPARLGPQDS